MTMITATLAPAADRKPPARRLFVAVEGNDDWSGSLPAPNAARTDGPLATLERARDQVRRMKQTGGLPQGGVSIELRGGDYERSKTFELTAEDSGSSDARIVYRGYQNEPARLIGGRAVRGFQPVTDADVLKRLDPAARGKVLQADLRSLGISDFGSAAGGGIELFFQDRPMTLARWPNQGFTHIVKLVGGSPFQSHGRKGDKIGNFVYEGDRPSRWVGESDVWLHGYWFWDWSDQRQRVASIDPAARVISLAPPYHSYGYHAGQWYYAFNVLAELDSPGEWYVDRQTGTLYFWPPAPVEAGHPVVSVIPTLVSMNRTSHVTLEGITLGAARATGVSVVAAERVRLERCVLRNLGGGGVTIAGGKQNTVSGCQIYNTGGGGISLSGGDRKSLTPAGNTAENNHIHHYARWYRMYHPAISMAGVGQRAAHNLIHDAPHEAIQFGGNDHLIELNEIHHVCTESNDAGAIYAGRDWTMRGTVIRHNFLHHINGFEGRGCVGVYLDDMFSGTRIEGNVFFRVTRAAFIGGGRDNVVENNIFVDCKPALHVDARALGWAKSTVPTTMMQRLEAMPYRQPPWSERYPKLVNILDDEPAAPRGNVVARNVVSGGHWDEIEAKARPLLMLKDNLLDQDPKFIDAGKLNFQLRDDSPAYKLGFKRIPIDRIGLSGESGQPPKPVSGTLLNQAEASKSRVIVRNTAEHPRNGEGALLPLADGRLLLVYTQWYARRNEDHSPARLMGMTSADGGTTWSTPVVVQKNVGQMNVMSASLVRTKSGRILLIYIKIDSNRNADLWVRESRDEAATWSEPRPISQGTSDKGYIVAVNSAAVRLQSGRILMPAYESPGAWGKDEHFVACTYYSDNEGATWKRSANTVDCPKRGAMEPVVAELAGGDVLMLCRTQMGHAYRATSRDGGVTWSAATPTKIVHRGAAANHALAEEQRSGPVVEQRRRAGRRPSRPSPAADNCRF